VGYGRKFVERERARELRAEAWTLQEIADELGVAKGSVSVWVRDVAFTPKPRNRGHSSQRPHPLVDWLRRYFDIDEDRMRARLYLHEGLDLEAAITHRRVMARIAAITSRFDLPG
jgi:transcriptional regulator with XRE-family HTH domain